MLAPTLDPKTNGRFGQIEVLAGPDESLYYRVFGRGKEGKSASFAPPDRWPRISQCSLSAVTPICQ